MLSRRTSITLKKISLATDVIVMLAFFLTNYLILDEATAYRQQLPSEEGHKILMIFMVVSVLVKLVDVVCIMRLIYHGYAPGILPPLIVAAILGWYVVIITNMWVFGLFSLLLSIGGMVATSLAFKAVYVYGRLQLAKTTNQYLEQVI